MARTKLVFFSLLFISYCGFAQSGAQQEINDQVWKPFIKAFNSRNTPDFMRVHSRDMVRVLRNDEKTYGYDTYYRENEKYNKDTVNKQAIELRFVQRIAGEQSAFETGYYKTTYTSPQTPPSSFYGAFQVLLRKEKGTWKILMDSDSSAHVTEQVFQTGKPMQ